MAHDDYPALYQTADDLSLQSQTAYLRTIKLYILLLVLAAALSTYAGKNVINAILSALVFLGSLALSVLLATKKYDRLWYFGRAVAESVKTRTWRFVMRAEPYHEPEEDVARRMFVSDLRQILGQNKELAQSMVGNLCTRDTVTERMTQIRNFPVHERKNVYEHARIDDQRNWYGKKSMFNTREASKWFWLMIGLQFIAVLYLLLQISHPGCVLFPTPLFAVAAGGCLTWMQVKKFRELSASYNLTAYEIGFIREQISNVSTDKELSDFVKDAENAFSREHTQWAARRDV